MIMETLEQRVKRVVASELAVDLAQIGNQDSFVGNLGADSLARVELVTALETEFELTIPDDQADSLQTVQQVIDYLRQASEQAVPA
ncbi:MULTISPECIES: 2-hexyl-5-propylresorcinol biosynthesis acyl carrier protein DarC [Pseudomonas]|uniref:2-hexyl-5-propylresorcinol biosynthesis acyl carrier protein DarC n=1 Tax=Pseudomonas TaxID=286 RepID=UPI000E1BEF01|nr:MULTISPECIES: 2-hexyl-5-propylresorcinol biosynthesis acyl carrier protein DarC [Pseudomonas]KAA5840037.1 2-hexyl-5-propylresorcinol biosynthesis acyl carrier protein DarC [Pseudomonas chlororaphis]KAB0534230.1 2-hexyl-5-propylresorcinol biosynthesis acyl carrier protein DarC [Pseudomonas chlororaphis subsp. aureofaciens]MBP5063805.1 2-hexyl-5-propylresorcinol biosynthesis acyl carrier protein DarC [Pseudomonas chlororaphis]QTT95643.1 2-hexyl-5-propylresorcinol biosynthesis acyl carrier prot